VVMVGCGWQGSCSCGRRESNRPSGERTSNGKEKWGKTARGLNARAADPVCIAELRVSEYQGRSV